MMWQTYYVTIFYISLNLILILKLFDWNQFLLTCSCLDWCLLKHQKTLTTVNIMVIIKTVCKIKNIFISIFFIETFFFAFIISFHHWITNNTSWMFTILQSTRFQIYIFFAHVMFFFQMFAFTLAFIVIPLLIWVTFSIIIKLVFTFAWYMFSNVFDSIVLVIILKALKFSSSILFETHSIWYHGSSRVLQHLLHLSKLTMDSR